MGVGALAQVQVQDQVPPEDEEEGGSAQIQGLVPQIQAVVWFAVAPETMKTLSTTITRVMTTRTLPMTHTCWLLPQLEMPITIQCPVLVLFIYF